MLYIVEITIDGRLPPGYELFTSKTNSVNVRFISGFLGRRTGFTADVRSISCDSVDSGVQEIVIAAGEVIEDALVTETESDGLYRNHALQEWKIKADENQVNM